ncbi:MAG: C40 family peptidase [Bacteroidia bacterium]|nr:C40 family peptidase [Bacteroidia bacterium]
MSYRISEIVAAVRAFPTSQSEQVNQALLGEEIQLLATEKDWIQVQLPDGYIGWIAESMIREIMWNESQILQEDLAVEIESKGYFRRLWIARGSYLPIQPCFEIGEKKIKCLNRPQWIPGQWQPKQLIPVAFEYLGTPYLWGGRSPWGIDCSGLIQMVVLLNGGGLLPRDAHAQAAILPTVSWEQRQIGDLVYFSNEHGKIIHVGILLDSDQILHAYGHVRISNLTDEGILLDWKNGFSHQRPVVHRLPVR